MKVKLFTIIVALMLTASVLYGATVTYEYDDLHRLKRVQRSDGTFAGATYGVTDNGEVSTGVWTHIAVTADVSAGTIIFYVNVMCSK